MPFGYGHPRVDPSQAKIIYLAANSIRLWDIIGEGQVTSIAKLASECFKNHGRPLRIAVDEAAWRFNNLTDEQTAKIQEGKYTQEHIPLDTSHVTKGY